MNFWGRQGWMDFMRILKFLGNVGNFGNLELVGADEFVIVGVVRDGFFEGAGVPGFVEWFVVVFVVLVVIVIIVGFCRPYGA